MLSEKMRLIAAYGVRNVCRIFHGSQLQVSFSLVLPDDVETGGDDLQA
jgi:hypothetical protein